MPLRLEPEQIRQTAALLRRLADFVDHEAITLGRSLHNLERSLQDFEIRLAAFNSSLAASGSSPHSLNLNWDASRIRRVMTEIQGVVNQLAMSRDDAQIINHKLLQFVEKWEDVDQQGKFNLLGTVEIQGDQSFNSVEEFTEINGSWTTPETPGRSQQKPMEVFPATGNVAQFDNFSQKPDSTVINSEGEDEVVEDSQVGGNVVVGGIPVTRLDISTSQSHGTSANQAEEKIQPVAASGSWSNTVARLEQTHNEIAQLEQLTERGPLDEHRLRELYEQQQHLQATVEAGIPANGRDPATNPFLEGQCTWFATSKRDLYPAVHGDAKYWAEQAANSGLEVGNVPVRGSVMVWQPGVFKAHEEFGHVSFVEDVKWLADGSFKVFYTDNLNPDKVREVVVSPDMEGVDFIY
jgi:hypothetical protein